MRYRLVLASIFAAMLALLTPLEAEAVECVGDRTYETAVADGCTSITGNLRIENTSLTNIDGLAALTSVVDDLYIDSNAALTNLDGLAALTSVVDNLYIRYNPALTNIDGLAALTSVGGSLYIQNNDALTNLDGLAALTSVVDDLYIHYNPALTNLDGLAALTDVGSNLYIANNPALTNLDGLAALTSVVDNLYIDSNAALTNLDGLAALTDVGSNLYIRSNPALTNLDGLAALTSVVYNLDINYHPALTNIDGLSSLTDVGGLSIHNNDALTNLDGLAALTSVGSDLSIYENIKMCQQSVDNLLNRISVGGSVQDISGNTGACGPTCGDGNVDPGELCDDGNILDGDCCSSTCEVDPADTICGPAADICDIEEVCDGTSPTCPADERLPDTDTDGTCDAYDICPDDADPSQADTDEDGLGDACDPCTGGILAYKPLLKATNFATGAGDDKLKYKAKLIFDDAVSISPQNQGFRLLVEDADADVLIDLDIPAGLYDPIARSGWIPTPNGKKFQYITKTPVDGMLPKVILKWNPKKANEVLVIVNGKSGDFAEQSVTLPLRATVSLDPTDLTTSLCAEAEFPGPKPLPYCRMSGNGVSVTCK